MRRLLAFTLLLLLISQTSGAAFAATPGGADAPPLGSDIASMLAPWRSAVMRTQLYAQLTGQEARYEALHQSRPLFEPHPRQNGQRPNVNKARLVTPREFTGIGVPEVAHYLHSFDQERFGRSPMPVRRARNTSTGRLGSFSARTRRSNLATSTAANTTAANSLPGLTAAMAPSRAGAHAVKAATTSEDEGAGLKNFWTYQPRSIPGIGIAQLNVNTGNLMVSATDFDVAGTGGLDLAFQRYYNSQSLRDVTGDDGGEPSIYGNQWTNVVDAHLVYYPPTSGSSAWMISAYDGTGARYDYTYNSTTQTWTPPAGMHATLGVDPSDLTGCDYVWQQTNGTILYFSTPEGSGTGGCTVDTGSIGRLYEIVGRNQNNTIKFAYTWTGTDHSTPQNIHTITATHSDGQSYLMTFALFNGHNELKTLKRPNGQSIAYSYDNSGNLDEVELPGNDAAATISQTYATAASAFTACGPRATSYLQGTTTLPDGACALFEYDASNRAIDWVDDGVLNPTPVDGMPTATALQSGPATTFTTGWNDTTFKYTAAATSMSDINGHATTWGFSAAGADTTTTTTRFVAGPNLVTSQTWDANENLIASVDAGSNETDYSYDGNGNLVVESMPLASVLVNGATANVRPTSYFNYDKFNNITAYCDPVYNALNSNGWNNTGSDTLCSAVIGTTRTAYGNKPTYEPFGELTKITRPSNFITLLTYATTGTDYGLPTEIKGNNGAAIVQADTTSRLLDVKVTYEPSGLVNTYNNGVGTTTLAYDGMNRLASTIDADGVGSYTCWNNDGTVNYTETAYQHWLDGSPTACSAGAPAYAVNYGHDTDGDVTSETHHFGWGSTGPSKTADVTQRFYDGLDRLVEVQEPYSAATDLYTNPWITRYLYDLTGGGTVSFNKGTAYSAFGNLYKIQELLPSSSSSVATFAGTVGSHVANNALADIRGMAYDALDRQTKLTTLVTTGVASPPPAPTQNTQTMTYDAGGYNGAPYPGLLNEVCNAVKQCEQYGYNTINAVTHIQPSGASASPNSVRQYDAAGHLTALGTGDSVAATTSFAYTYNTDGLETTQTEPTNYSSWATVTYDRYADGMLEYLSVKSSGYKQSDLYGYSYNNDGSTERLAVNNGSATAPDTTLIQYGYTAAGRPSMQAELWPNAGGNILATPPPNTSYSDTSSVSYNAYGQPLTMTFPGTVDPLPLAYGAEDQLISGSRNYTVRGELFPKLSATGDVTAYYANSVLIPTGQASTWDYRMGVLLENNTYDAAGREIDVLGGTMPTRAYDQENHLLSSITNSVVSNQKWGPNGHPVAIGNVPTVINDPLPTAAQQDTLHWSGDQLLFTTNPAGHVDDIKVGAAGDITPQDPGYTDLTLYDRGPDSAVGGCYNAEGSSAYVDNFPYLANTIVHGYTIPVPKSPCGTTDMPNTINWWTFGPTPPSPLIGSNNGIIGMPRPDGIVNSTDIIQGVRAFNEGSGIWESPDAYPPDLNNPITLKSYVWNENNPIANQDPSGFVSVACLEDVDKKSTDASGACYAAQAGDNPNFAQLIGVVTTQGSILQNGLVIAVSPIGVYFLYGNVSNQQVLSVMPTATGGFSNKCIQGADGTYFCFGDDGVPVKMPNIMGTGRYVHCGSSTVLNTVLFAPLTGIGASNPIQLVFTRLFGALGGTIAGPAMMVGIGAGQAYTGFGC
jgi:YD repeat-containing protein